MENDFLEWIEHELKVRGWKPAELARRSGIENSVLSNVMNGKRGAGPEFCNAIARGLGLPPVMVFEKAGLLPVTEPTDDAIRAVTYQLQNMPAPMRELFVKMINTQYAEWEVNGKSEPKTQPRKPDTGPLKDPSKA